MPEVETIRHNQSRGTFEDQRFTQSSVGLPGNGTKLFLSECTQVGPFGQILPQQATGGFVDSPLPGTVRVQEVDLLLGCSCQLLIRLEPMTSMRSSPRRIA